jgi:signal transduction histidine kinase
VVESWLQYTPLACTLDGASDLWAVCRLLVEHLCTLPRQTVRDFVHERYELLPRGLRQAILGARAAAQREALQESLCNHLRSALAAFEAEVEVELRTPEATIAAALESTRWRTIRPLPDERLARRSPAELLDLLLDLDPAPLARRIIKDAVMARSPLHAAVGEATDQGVRVHPRTQVTRGTPDPTRYEAGNFLVAVGAGGAGVRARPWQIRLFRPHTPEP